MHRVVRAATILVVVAFLFPGCGWHHRVQVPSPVGPVGDVKPRWSWAFFWKSHIVKPDEQLCVSQLLKEVDVHSNWAFALLRVVTLGIVSPARVDPQCAAPIVIDPANPDTQPSACPDSDTYWSFGWGRLYQIDPLARCNDRAMSEVKIKANPIFDLISVVTLGGVAPARIGWECAPSRKDAAPAGRSSR